MAGGDSFTSLSRLSFALLRSVRCVVVLFNFSLRCENAKPFLWAIKKNVWGEKLEIQSERIQI
jgi:hypothetical protein